MSKRQDGVLITAPLFGVGREKPEEFPGYSCGYCQGNGYVIDPDIITECVKSRVPRAAVQGK